MAQTFAQDVTRSQPGERTRPSTYALIAAVLVTAIALAMVFLVAPREATMGDIQRIFYFHVAASWTGYLALLVAFVAGLLYLRRGQMRHDLLAASSAEIGLLFISGGIITGSLWAKPIWGTWWTWDPRLTTSAILWLMYAAYLVLRGAVDDIERRARLGAVYSIVAFVAVPLNFMAIRWWRAMHPLVLESSGAGLTSTMLLTLIISVIAFTLTYVAMLSFRVRLAVAEEQLRRLKLR